MKHRSHGPADGSEPEEPAPHHRYSFEDGARLLRSELALPELSPGEAFRIVPFMKLTLARPDSVLFRAGGPGSQFLVMLMSGDAVVEGCSSGGKDWMVLRTLAPGSLFGEMGAMDSMARSVVVRATSATCLATLDEDGLIRLTAHDPVLACTLLRAILAHMTRRLRAANNKIETLNEINQALRAEWHAEIRSDLAARARLSVLMKLEGQLAASGNDSRPSVRKLA
ncbi:cyclic nucleotide-binding domain-containing protein [Ramlibacter sp.]|uniref:Crp/Fnr family transcriptional regulator n=1 Tax=Ramlibacter sp. TaxID=1917967 RepID=UPI002C797173|nr:cyclic nucleotide-binding domain-containing protein [Ramlibacter sp.]HWI84170.1 cyclic nucleotide-binding domain-containing protein [Ramlibacter sp.]